MQAFHGIRVLDLTHVLAGPFSTYQLAVLGADVIKVEGPASHDMNREIGAVGAFNDIYMGSHFQSQAANKRAITLNLKTKEGCQIFKSLAETTDVIVENYRPGKLDALGLGYDDICTIKPDIVYCSLTGFGQTGPKRTHAAFDNTIQAYSGLMLQTGPADGDAVLVGGAVLDYGTGAQAAFAIAAALLRRERTGKGQYIDIAMLDAALMLTTSGVLNANTTKRTPGRTKYARIPFAGYGGYETADAILMIGAVTPVQYSKLWRALGREDLAREVEGLRTPDMATRCKHDEAILIEIFKTKTADEWESILIEADLPAARVRTLNEALASKQVASRSVIGKFASHHSANNELKPTISAFGCNKDGPTVTSSPPEFGEHTDDILGEIGIPAEKIVELRERGVV
jgi:crotonobetainyl-CoA:carnitine CoA-transferase CaiB-like acyl-CoA transferase